MKLQIQINLDSKAFVAEGQTRRFKDGSEAARILRSLAAEFEDCFLEIGQRNNLKDKDSNSVGEAKVTR